MKIETEFWLKPDPCRQFDWSAIDSDTYDGAPDSHCKVGYGPTEQAAIRDLHDQMNDEIVSDFEDDPGLSPEENEAKLQREIRKLDEAFAPYLKP